MLKQRFDEAKELRAHVSEYNIIAKKILAYPSREDMMKYVACTYTLVLYKSTVTALRNYSTKSRNMTMQVPMPRMD